MKNIAIFVAGMFAGGAAAYFGLKNVFAKRANEEVESVKEYYRNNAEKPEKTEEPVNEEQPETPPVRDPNKDITEYLKVAAQQGYVNYSDKSAPKDRDENGKARDDIYVIEPDEYGQGNDYDVIQLTYYAGDGVLADDGDMKIADIEGTVGDAISHIGEYEDDIVHVRNNRLRSDFEIVRDLRRWDDVIGDEEAR